MGKTVAILDQRELPERLPSLSTMLLDLSENVHVHTRELRQEMSLDEFYVFCTGLFDGAADLNHYLENNPEYKEGAVHVTIRKATGAPSMLDGSPAPNQSAYWPRRLLIELIEPHEMGDIHLHWRDYRLQMTRTEFRALADSVAAAREKLDRVEAARFPEVARRQRTTAEIDALCEAGKSVCPGPGHFVKVREGGKP